MSSSAIAGPALIERPALDELLRAIAASGYQIAGPAIRDGAIVYSEIHGANELPAGWTDRQEPGSYRLTCRNDAAVFGFAVGPHSAKKYLLPPRMRLWGAIRAADGCIAVQDEPEPARKVALIGIRSCDLLAIAIQDKVMIGGSYPDPFYASQRENLLLIAVNCMAAAATCFCDSMGAGPRATSGYDLALTELVGDGPHRFLVEIGSVTGARLLESVPHRPASDTDLRSALRVTERTRAELGRRIDTAGIKELLYANLENPRWDEVAARCLGCANCTMVCPTCFCTTVEDHADLEGSGAERVREWDSCFTLDFSHLHGGSVRNSIKSRYRQWMTHKLASWLDQFGSSGCVGCGRCITWCPVGIDITEEAAAIRARDARRARTDSAREE